MDPSIWKQGPMWARPRMPFEDVLAGTRSGGGFNPGGAFGPKQQPFNGGGGSGPIIDDPRNLITDPGAGGGGQDLWSQPRQPGGPLPVPTPPTRPGPQGGGYTLPSLQRWNKLAPSEQAMQTGIWKDEAQVDPNDVMSLMNKLRPANAQSFAPRWMGY